MCGIAGVYFFSPEERARKETLQAMAATMAHRGPDSEGIYINGHVGLAHRRLKIIDTSDAAAQPMSAENSTLIFNGEIYNFRELRKELTGAFHSSSDTEVVLRLFLRDRDKTWHALNGMFAIAVYDAEANNLYLARDHAGVKPLYYWLDSEKVLFASEIKAILRSGLVRAETDHDSLSLYLQFGYLPGERTIYKNIKKISPGQSFKISSKEKITSSFFWNLPESTGDSPQNATEHLDHLLARAVERQMISDVPLGAFLSGGLDSSLIVALMRDHSKDPVKTFTIGFSRMGYYDERPHARKVAKLFHTEHHEFVIEEGIRDVLPQFAGVFDEPFADSSAIPTLSLAKLARQHVIVALSGTGGDEIFGGYRKYMAAHWAGLYGVLPAGLRNGLSAGAALLPASRRSLWRERALLLQRFLAMSPKDNWEVQVNSIFQPGEIGELTGKMPPNLLVKSGSNLAEKLMDFDYRFYLPDDLLVKEDRCTMAFGLEARVPFLDREIIEFITRLPLKYKVSGRQTKRLFRKVADRRLPREIINRPKHGFGSPVAEWLRGELKDYAADLLFAPNALFSGSIIRRKFTEHVASKADHNRQLWALLMLELWRRKEIKQ